MREKRFAIATRPSYIAEKETVLVTLQEAEDWLYSEEGEGARNTKSAYFAKLDALKALGNPTMNRWKESKEGSCPVS